MPQIRIGLAEWMAQEREKSSLLGRSGLRGRGLNFSCLHWVASRLANGVFVVDMVGVGRSGVERVAMGRVNFGA
jgi:hypothetical protein